MNYRVNLLVARTLCQDFSFCELPFFIKFYPPFVFLFPIKNRALIRQHQPLIILLFTIFNHHSFFLRGHIQQFKSVLHQFLFDRQVKRAVSAKTGTLVDLKKPRLQVLVNHDIKPQNLKALRIF